MRESANHAKREKLMEPQMLKNKAREKNPEYGLQEKPRLKTPPVAAELQML